MRRHVSRPSGPTPLCKILYIREAPYIWSRQCYLLRDFFSFLLTFVDFTFKVLLKSRLRMSYIMYWIHFVNYYLAKILLCVFLESIEKTLKKIAFFYYC